MQMMIMTKCLILWLAATSAITATSKVSLQVVAIDNPIQYSSCLYNIFYRTFLFPLQIQFIEDGTDMVYRADGYKYTLFRYGRNFLLSQRYCADRNASLAGVQTELDQKVFKAAM